MLTRRCARHRARPSPRKQRNIQTTSHPNAQLQLQQHTEPDHSPHFRYSPLSQRQQQLSAFLPHVVPLTQLPTPMQLTRRKGQFKLKAPENQMNIIQNEMQEGTSANMGWWFPSTVGFVQERMSVMRACLEGGWDVERAKLIFERMRRDNDDPDVIHTDLSITIYNTFLRSYLSEAEKAEAVSNSSNQNYWLAEFYSLLDSMISNPPRDEITSASTTSSHEPAPDKETFQLALLALSQFASYVPTDPLARSIGDIIGLAKDWGFELDQWLILDEINEWEKGSDAIEMVRRWGLDKGNFDVLKVVSPPSTSATEENNKAIFIKTVHKLPSKKGKETEENEPKVPENLTRVIGALQESLDTRLLFMRSRAASSSNTTTLTELNPLQAHLEQLSATVARERYLAEQENLNEIGRGGEMAMKRGTVRNWLAKWTFQLEEYFLNGRIVEKKPTGEVEERQDLEVESENEPLMGALEKLRREEFAPMKWRDAASETPISPFLALLHPASLALVTVTALLRTYGSGRIDGTAKAARTMITIGQAVEEEWNTQRLTKERKDRLKRRKEGVFSIPSAMPARGPDGKIQKPRVKDCQTGWEGEWSHAIRAKVGAWLIDSVMKIATVHVEKEVNGTLLTEMHPAFLHAYDYVRGHKLGVIKLHPLVLNQMSKEPMQDHLPIRHLPMLVKPRSWEGEREGGYLVSQNPAMRYKDSAEQQIYMREASAAGNLDLLYSGLDVLGETPWIVNDKVFEVMLEVWNSGKELGRIPPEKLELEDPPAPDMDDPNAKSIYVQRMQANNVARANNHSERCNVNYKLEIARAFLKEKFYFPHNVDFRGRAYPMPPHLNHIGDDLSRGLLLFADAKPLEVAGLRWLKLHLASLYGYDKASFSDRLIWVESHLDDIKDSALNPLNGRRWWTEGDEPWQVLATCMELTKALDSPDPTTYMSRLPIHQDGTCNGLQHYAALGGDLEGAKQVNLVEADKPSDVYTHVADLVEKMVQEDAKKGNELAQVVQGKISRKVVKQTVMTTVYGVTFVGAREQIHKQLVARGDIPTEKVYNAAFYVAQQVMAAIGNLFSNANAIMLWLTLCAKVIARSIPGNRADAISAETTYLDANKRIRQEQMTSVIWTTPLGLPVVQPYRKVHRRQLKTSLQTVYISDPTDLKEVDSRKQTTAFPPNFIHSLDATHMILTALECRAMGITFASVHDSYWTHASTIDDMSLIIRNTFIDLHSSNVLAKLQEEFRTRYAGYKVPVSSLGYNKNLLDALRNSVRTGEFSDDLNKARKRIARKKGKVTKVSPVTEDSADVIEDEAAQIETEAVMKELKKTRRNGSPRKGEATTGTEGTENALEALSDVLEDDVVPANETSSGTFLDINDLLPPIPKKGLFDVKHIKESKYFFS